MNKIRSVVVIAACLALLGACARFVTDETEVTFIDHIAGGMIEQDVFVEKVPGSGEVFRLGKDEAMRHGDAPLFRTTRPLNHAPFSPARNGPYPKGAGLGVSLGDWRAATGIAKHTCKDGAGRLQAVFRRLIPNGTYTMWYFRVAKDHMGCPDCPFATIDFPVGAKDGSQSSFVADVRGDALFDASFKPCLTPGDDQLAAALAIAYHSDGDTYGPSPGDMGAKTHIQLFTLLPDEGDD